MMKLAEERFRGCNDADDDWFGLEEVDQEAMAPAMFDDEVLPLWEQREAIIRERSTFSAERRAQRES